MTAYKLISFFVLSASLLISCNKGGEKDLEKPQIVFNAEESSPKNCNVYKKGTVIPVNCIFTDNIELGNFNIEIHNNFDHHTHGTEKSKCSYDANKKPVNPWIFNKDYSIPAGSSVYNVDMNIPVPEDIDEGDYHLMIRLTDKSGWQQLRSFSIKIQGAL